MPTSDGRPLSERLLNAAWRIGECMKLDVIGNFGEEIAALEEAARLLAAQEQAGPGVAELGRRIRALKRAHTLGTVVEDLEAHAAALGRLAEVERRTTEAERQADAVSGLPEKWGNCFHRHTVGSVEDGACAQARRECAAQLTAALVSPGPSLRERVQALRDEFQALVPGNAGPWRREFASRLDAALRGEVTE